MPRNFKLTWQPGKDGRTGRWRKKYNGQRYYFPGGAGKYDREAYEAALGDWDKLKVKIDREAPRKHERDYEAAIGHWEKVIAWCSRHGEPQLAETAFQKLGALRKMLADPVLEPLPVSETFEATFAVPTIDLGEILGNGPMPAEIAQMKLAGPLDLSPEALARHAEAIDGSPMRIAQEIWRDRLEVESRKAAPQETSLGAYVEKYLVQKQNQASAGELSVGRIRALKLHLEHFLDFVGKDTDVKEIDGAILARYHSHLLSKVTAKEWGRTNASDRITTVKSLVRWLWETEALPSLPRIMNGRAKYLSITKGVAKVTVFTKDEIKTLLASASERTQLYILLMLNCGMTQKDVSDLLISEVDWDVGRVIRKRSKTADEENVPTVNYRLWPETLRLLRQERAAESEDRVLLNTTGSPLWSEEITDEGKYLKNDNIKNAFDRLRTKTKITKPLKSFKKTSASLLRDNEKYSGLAGLFLGHAPQTMSDKHYTQVPQGLLDQAIEWLGMEYGLV